MSKDRLREMLQSDREERDAIGHHSEKLAEHTARIREINIRLDKLEPRMEMLETWHAVFSRVNVWRRLKWLLSGR